MMKHIILCGALSMVLSACNTSDNADVRNLVDEDVREAGLTETWTSECRNIPFDLLGLAAQKEEYRIGGDISKITTFYENNECTEAVVEIQETGSYGNVEKSGDIWEIDINWKKAEAKAKNDRGTDILQTINFCGFNEWPVDQTQDITDRTSENPALVRCWTLTPRDQFDIFQIKDDTLYFGSGSDKSKIDDRPTSIDDSVGYKK